MTAVSARGAVLMQFDDYHRTIVGYHGTRLSVALDIVNRRRGFKYSRNRDDWLGHGIYFWEYAPQQAPWWAERRQRRQKWNEPIAILASMIRLGYCLDLLDPHNVTYMVESHGKLPRAEAKAGRPITQNANHRKYLDCAVFQYVYALADDDRPVDTARAVYVPTGEEKRVWTRSWISNGAHIQVCVRNTSSILGTWLHYPTDLEDHDGGETGQTTEIAVEHPVRPIDRPAEEDVDGGPDPAPRQSGPDGAGRGGPGEAAADR